MLRTEDQQKRVDEAWARLERRQDAARFAVVEPAPVVEAKPASLIPTAPEVMPEFVIQVFHMKDGQKVSDSYTVTARDLNHAENIALQRHRQKHNPAKWSAYWTERS